MALADHVGREAVEEPSHIRRRRPPRPAPEREEGGQRRPGDRQHQDDVVSRYRPPQNRDRRPQGADQEHRCVVHQVDAGRVEQPVVDERVVTVQHQVGKRTDEPAERSGIGVTVARAGQQLSRRSMEPRRGSPTWPTGCRRWRRGRPAATRGAASHAWRQGWTTTVPIRHCGCSPSGSCLGESGLGVRIVVATAAASGHQSPLAGLGRSRRRRLGVRQA